MDARVRILFQPPTAEDWERMQSMGRLLTNRPDSVAVAADDDPNWLIATFSMPTEPQNQAAEKIIRAMRFCCLNYRDCNIHFPYTAAQRARADRKNARLRAKRRARREGQG